MAKRTTIMDKKLLQILTFSMLTTSILYPTIPAFAMHEEGLDSCYAQCDTKVSQQTHLEGAEYRAAIQAHKECWLACQEKFPEEYKQKYPKGRWYPEL
ncbi:MAG: hypothetical protein KA112_02610 [Alphaproteobacteria bacterium]|jgi:hypothetical protein|nr:hypothetical protein [Alphaproteobacteria bacterium]